MNFASIALAGVGLYVYLKYYDPSNSAPRQTGVDKWSARPAPAALTDRRWTASRFLNNINPNEWYRYDSDPAAVVQYTRDSWKRQDDAYNPEVLAINPQRRAQRRLVTGGTQARVNFRAPVH